MNKQKVTCLVFTILTMWCHTVKCQQTCQLLSPVKMSPLDNSVPFVTDQFAPFQFNFDSKLSYKVSLKSNIIFELSDNNIEKSPTFSGGGICVGDDIDCVFKFERFAFNWKINEDLSHDGKEYPLESHFIFVNQK